MHLLHVQVQYDRLQRHHQSALRDKDEISFLDLAHVLRVWVDMKAEVSRMVRERGIDLELHHHTTHKFIKQTLRGATHTYIPIASGTGGSELQVKGVRITNRALTPEEIMMRASLGPPVAQVSKMSFTEWLAAGVIEVPSGNDEHPHIQLSRETIIKRVANVLGASHPIGIEEADTQENRFDSYILELHGMHLGDGYPATYYQLLEIAGELLTRLKKLRVSAA